MILGDLLRDTLDVDCYEIWGNKRIPTPVRVFWIRFYSMRLSVVEVAAVLGLLGVARSHWAVWNWTHNLAESQVDSPTVYP